MKQLIPNYSFSAANKTVTFTDFKAISLERVLLITNATNSTIIYNLADPNAGGSVSGNVLTLEYNTTSMLDTDRLTIMYECAPGDPYYDDPLEVTITETGGIPIDVNPRIDGEGPKTTDKGVQVVSLAGAFGELIDSINNAIATYSRIAGIDPATGQERVARVDGSAGLAVGGGIVSGTTDYGNPVKVGGKYNATSPTFTDGQRGDLQIDQAGRLLVALGSLIAGEDLTNNVLGTLQAPVSSATYSPSAATNWGTAISALVKASPGNVYSFRVTNSSPYVRYFQLHNKVTVPTFSDVPSRVFLVPAGSVNQPSVVELDMQYFAPSWRLSTGVGWAWSTNPGSFVPGASAADHTVDLSYA